MEYDEIGRPVPPPDLTEEPPPELWDEPPLHLYHHDFAGEPQDGLSAEASPLLSTPAPASRPPRVRDTDPRSVLREVFGYDSFRPLQGEVIDSILALRDTLAIMPTGGGKSLCYQIPALLFDGLTIVVSPLISLMQDQARQLDAAGVEVAVLNSMLSRREYARNRAAVRSGRARLLYVAPETLFLPRTLALLRDVPLSCLTIDEAHCISEWGHDFRPEYRRLTEIRSWFPHAVCVGLTATATPRVREDIAQSLGFSQDARFVASFDRPNLVLRVAEKDRPVSQLLRFIESAPGKSGIVYCATRRGVESLAERLAARGLSVRPYHAGLSDEERRQNQERFIRDDVDIIVATVAFGMGINKPDVRFVAHHDLPKSVEAYYQQIGRAGRDGLPSECLLLYGTADLVKNEYFIAQKESEQEQRVARLQLGRMQAFAETTVCRRRPLLDYFGETYAPREAPDGCGACDNCVEPRADLRDITVEAQKFLSCVYRTGQRFGAGHIVDVLRGSQSQKVLRAGHQGLSTYGIGQEHDATQWRHIGRQLLQHSLLSQDPNYGGLQLTEAAARVLRGEQTVEGRLRKPAAKTAQRARTTALRSRASTADHGLYEVLRSLRKQLADEANVPPYVVFSNQSLLEMSARRPRSTDDLAEIHGVGQVKLARYGAAFLGRIGEWCRTQGLPEPEPQPKSEPERVYGEPEDEAPKPKRKRKPKIKGLSAAELRRIRIVEGIAQGRTLRQLADEEGISLDTACGHVEGWLDGGGQVDAAALRTATELDERALDAAVGAFEATGEWALKPAREALEVPLDWPEMRMARLVWIVSVTG